MSSGKIVIASDAGGIPEIIQNEKNGLLFEKGNAIDLEQKIISVLEKTYDTTSIRKNARNTMIIDYQWKERTKQISQIYRNMIK